jgi:TPR repeat protein
MAYFFRPVSVLALPTLLLCSGPLQAQTMPGIDALREQAEQGNDTAQLELGLMYDTGEGVTQDFAEAAHWYRLAAEQGNNRAQFNLGIMYVTGEGVPQDYVLAHMWLNLAASRATLEVSENAARHRNKISELMTPTQIGEAQRLAREWITAHPR